MDWLNRHLISVQRTMVESNEHLAKLRRSLAKDREDMVQMQLMVDKIFASFKETGEP